MVKWLLCGTTYTKSSLCPYLFYLILYITLNIFSQFTYNYTNYYRVNNIVSFWFFSNLSGSFLPNLTYALCQHAPLWPRLAPAVSRTAVHCLFLVRIATSARQDEIIAAVNQPPAKGSCGIPQTCLTHIIHYAQRNSWTWLCIDQSNVWMLISASSVSKYSYVMRFPDRLRK